LRVIEGVVMDDNHIDRPSMPARMTELPRRSIALFALLLVLPVFVQAQGFFEQFFGGGHHQQHQQQQRQPGPAERWRAHGASIDCSAYLCPVTFDCVAEPVDCPCPNEQDTKCVIEDGASFVCVRADNDCKRAERAAKGI